MFTKSISCIVAVAATLTAAPSIAQTQLERSLGLQAGAISLAQQIELKRAVDQNDNLHRDHVLSQVGVEAMRDSTAFSSGRAAIHKAQIVESASRENEAFRVRHVTTGHSNDTTRAVALIKEQIAAEVGVDADAYTMAQLVKLQNDRQD